jgi:RNA polymerase sigma-B factor
VTRPPQKPSFGKAAEESNATGDPRPDGEFEQLFAEWKATGDPRLRERLILLQHNLVAYLAWRFADRGEALEDIIQQGTIGLIQAIDHFDPTRGVRFYSFAAPTIIGEIRRYFRDKASVIRIPRRVQEVHRTINQRIDSLTQELNRSPTYAEIARTLNMEVEEVIEALEMGKVTDPVSLDDSLPCIDGAPAVISDHIGESDPALELWNDKAALEAALNTLSEQERTVLEYAYFEGYSQAEISRRLQVSQMHVSRLLRRSLERLRKMLVQEQE